MVMIRKPFKGLNLSQPHTTTVDGSTSCLNVIKLRSGELINRNGLDQVNTSIKSKNLAYIYSNTTTEDYYGIDITAQYVHKNPSYSSKQELISSHDAGISSLSGAVWSALSSLVINPGVVPCFIQTPNATFIPNGSSLIKYDGQSFYNAGCYYQDPEQSSVLINGTWVPSDVGFISYNMPASNKMSVGLDAGFYRYAFRLKHIDANDNLTYSNFLNCTYGVNSNGDWGWQKYLITDVDPLHENVIIPVYNGTLSADAVTSAQTFIQNYTKYGYAIITDDSFANTGATVTVNVNAGHSLKAGDKIAFSTKPTELDYGVVVAEQRTVRHITVLSTTNTSITFNNPLEFSTYRNEFNFYKNQMLVAGLSLEVFRTAVGGTLDYFKIYEVPFPVTSPIGTAGIGHYSPTSRVVFPTSVDLKIIGLGLPQDAGSKDTSSNSTDTITCTAHGYSDNDILYFKAIPGGSLPAPLNNNTKYYIVSHTVNAFKISLSVGGPIITLTQTVASFLSYKVGLGGALGESTFVPAAYNQARLFDSMPDSQLANSTGYGYFSALAVTQPDIIDTYPDNTNQFGLPNRIQFGCYHQDSIFLAGDDQNPNLIYFSQPNTEVFDPLDNISVGTLADGKVLGLASVNDVLIVGCERQIFAVSGDITSGSYRVDRMSRINIGCTSHATMKVVNGQVYFLSKFGIFSIRPGGVPEEQTELCRQLFTQLLVSGDFYNAVAAIDVINSRYILHIPGSSYAVVYDYLFNEVYLYDNYTADGGIASFDDQTYLCERTGNKTKKVGSTHSDNGTPVSWYWESGWENLGEPELRSKLVYVTIVSASRGFPENTLAPNFSVTLSQYENFQGVAVANTHAFTNTLRKIVAKLNANYVHGIKLKLSGNADEQVLLSEYIVSGEQTQKKMT